MKLKVSDNAYFESTRGSHNAAPVIANFGTGKRILVVTYNVSLNSRMLIDGLAKSDPSAKVRLILNIPGRFECYFSGTIREHARDRIAAHLKLLSSLPDHIERYFLFSNHMKIVACDNLAYVGSANFSDESAKNLEAGVVITGDEVVNALVDGIWKDIVSDLVPFPGGDEVEWLKIFVYGFSEVPVGKVDLNGAQIESMIDIVASAKDLIASKPLPKWLPTVLKNVVARLGDPRLVDPDMPDAVVTLLSKLVDNNSLQALAGKLEAAPSDDVLRDVVGALCEQFDKLCDAVPPWVYPAPDNTDCVK